jgi:hypothetical protein
VLSAPGFSCSPLFQQNHLILGNQNCKSRFRKMNELQAIAFGGFGQLGLLERPPEPAPSIR